MPRKPRIEYAVAVIHILNRIRNRRATAVKILVYVFLTVARLESAP